MSRHLIGCLIITVFALLCGYLAVRPPRWFDRMIDHSIDGQAIQAGVRPACRERPIDSHPQHYRWACARVIGHDGPHEMGEHWW